MLTSVLVQRETRWAENDQSDRKDDKTGRDLRDLIGRSRHTGFLVT